MDHRRHILPSSFNAQDDPNGQSRVRQPLSDSAGNAQLHALASGGLYHDNKGSQPRVDRPIYTIPTVPSQPARQFNPNSLELRRQTTRRRRQHRHTRNPIHDSPQYQAYRARQIRDGAPESDQKWPEILEIAFLDALIDIPPMGRRKFSLRGKPHGRNELIAEYIWIAYQQGLPPGQKPDKAMMRSRKQVSSHIQVLKGFFREHPAFLRLFPAPRGANKNGFDDNFKSDATLRALSEGRVLSRRHDQYLEINQIINSNHVPMRPATFWLLISLGADPNGSWKYKSEEDIHNDRRVVHRYTGLSAERPRTSLESIPNWRLKWPFLATLHAANDLACDIIHMDVSLELTNEHAPEGAELLSRTEMIIPGTAFADSHWQSITSLTKPEQLYGHEEEVPHGATAFPIDVAEVTDTETRLRLQFPASPWAHAFTMLTRLQYQFEDMQKSQSGGNSNVRGPNKTARELINEVSMYQELRSAAPGMPYIRRAVIVWTFSKTKAGESGKTSWSYLDAAPSRSMIMSPPPHASHHVAASMNEQFNTWAETPLHLQQHNIMDTFPPGLVTPPQTAGLQSPFGSNYLNSMSHYDMPSEHLSFVSDATVDSDSTLVNHDNTTNIDNFLSVPSTTLGSDYEQSASNWHLPNTEVFDADPAWASYSVPSTTAQLNWDSPAKANHTWNETQESQASEKHDWHSNAVSPTKQGYTEHDNENISTGLPPLNATTPVVSTTASQPQNWVSSDAFDYEAHLGNRLK
ncbi:hypothetical protein BP5796_03318 [Coleophoma crateriformis]|uniref:TEA domain-containing protein n=1 Tax=Coleophoma crateriformis TaxID=565419 RepID=A0A3D8SN65_9HELO|nr:hypothetical protein BP5796_03318 [Coleophoma crateriformis]